MKKVLSLVLCAVMLLTAMPASADQIWDAIMNIPRNEAPDVYLNSVEISFDGDAYPQNVNGRVLVPFRAIAESYDAEVLYDEETKAITAKRGDTTISFRNGDYNMTVTKNGVESTVTMDVCPTLNTEFNRTMVPVRFLSEAFGLSVGWTGEDVIVADFRGLLAEVVEENALLSAIRDTRAENPTPFILERKGEEETMLHVKNGEITLEESHKVTFEGKENVDQNGYAFYGTETEEGIKADGTSFKEDFRTGEIVLDGSMYAGRVEKDCKCIIQYEEELLTYTDGETFLMDLAERTLLSAKSFDACMEDAILILENTQSAPDHYEKIKNGLLAANVLFTEESVVRSSGILDFYLTPEEYRARRLEYYKNENLSEENLKDIETTLDSMEVSYHLKGTFSESGEIVVLDKEYSQDVKVEIMYAEISTKETCTRIPGTPDAVAIPTNIAQ